MKLLLALAALAAAVSGAHLRPCTTGQNGVAPHQGRSCLCPSQYRYLEGIGCFTAKEIRILGLEDDGDNGCVTG